MEKETTQELNEAAMQIILHSGDGRNLINEAIRMTLADVSDEKVAAKMKEAKAEIVKAHRIQTEMIQTTIEDDDLQSTLLFSHAQDTLMTIYSELNMTHHLIDMYRKVALMIKDK